MYIIKAENAKSGLCRWQQIVAATALNYNNTLIAEDDLQFFIIKLNEAVADVKNAENLELIWTHYPNEERQNGWIIAGDGYTITLEPITGLCSGKDGKIIPIGRESANVVGDDVIETCTAWAARDKLQGFLNFYADKPDRNDYFWFNKTDKSLPVLPGLKFEDGPVPVEIVIMKRKEDNR